MKLLVILALPLLVVWGCEGANVKETDTLRVSNKDLSLSGTKVQEMLKKANLKGRGFSLRVISTKTQEPGSTTPIYVKTLYYYKVVSCDKVMQVEKDLNRLLNGVLGSSVIRKANKDLKQRKIVSGKQCEAGVEISLGGQTKGRRVKKGLWGIVKSVAAKVRSIF